jgi:hypothetical protein
MVVAKVAGVVVRSTRGEQQFLQQEVAIQKQDFHD